MRLGCDLKVGLQGKIGSVEVASPIQNNLKDGKSNRYDVDEGSQRSCHTVLADGDFCRFDEVLPKQAGKRANDNTQADTPKEEAYFMAYA